MDHRKGTMEIKRKEAPKTDLAIYIAYNRSDSNKTSALKIVQYTVNTPHDTQLPYHRAEKDIK